MEEHTGIITSHGNPLTLLGSMVSVGDKAPDFAVLGNDMNPVSLGDFEGKTLVIASVPSIDTAVCSMETHKFNDEAGNFGDDTKVLTISMDLPFAQKRWCAAEGIDNVITLSDHRDASFGMNYGVLIKELRLLARVVFIVDKSGIVRYRQVVPDTTNEPDYEDVLNALKDLG
jgi:thiol peroxidase